MITDGFPDQFGGPKGKKFMSKNLKELLVSLSNKPMLEIKDSLKKSLDEWRGNLEQVDDVLVVGVRV
jgi:serine phosphatase RsbU (regulator of sigma subunit)